MRPHPRRQASRRRPSRRRWRASDGRGADSPHPRRARRVGGCCRGGGGIARGLAPRRWQRGCATTKIDDARVSGEGEWVSSTGEDASRQGTGGARGVKTPYRVRGGAVAVRRRRRWSMLEERDRSLDGEHGDRGDACDLAEQVGERDLVLPDAIFKFRDLLIDLLDQCLDL